MLQRREAESIQQAETTLTKGFQGITKAQHQALEDKIKELRLDRNRVKDWICKASHQRFTNFMEISEDFYQLLICKLDDFAGVSNEH